MKRVKEQIFMVFNKLNLKSMMRNLLLGLIVIEVLLVLVQVTNVLKLLNLQHETAIITNVGLLICIIVLVILFFVSSFVFKLISDLTQYAKMLSNGKLNVKDISVQGNNDFNMLADYINNLKANLLFLLDQTKGNILVLSESIEKVSKNMDAILAENEQVSSEMQEISSKSQEQLNMVSNAVAKTDEVKNSAEVININIKEVEVMASDANLAAMQGKENLNVYNENIDLISKSIEDTNKFIKELKSSASEISNVVKFIVGLSKQLKLLSLNASIQAEGAGEAGKGFNVVAQEITKLSDSTKESIDKINTIVVNILNDSSMVERSTEKSLEYFKDGKNTFSKVEEIFNAISKKNVAVLRQINDVVSEALSINSNIKDTIIICEKVDASSTVVSQSTEEAAASIEQELEEFQGINLSMSELHNELDKIEKLITKFEIDIRPSKEDSKSPLKIAMLIPPLEDVWKIIKFGAFYGKKVLKAKNTTVKMIDIDVMNQDEYVKTLSKCIEDGYDGVITPGVFEEQLQLVTKANIPIITYNMDVKAKNKRILYVGENSYEAGIVAGKSMIEALGGKGKFLMITSNISLENFKLREQGIKNAGMSNKNITVDTLEVPLGDEEVYRIAKEYLNKNKDIDGILHITAGILGLIRAVEELNLSDKIKIIAFNDDTEKIIDYINNGTIDYTIGQDPFRQGYDSLIYMYNYLVTGEKPSDEEANTKIEVMDINKAKNFLG